MVDVNFTQAAKAYSKPIPEIGLAGAKPQPTDTSFSDMVTGAAESAVNNLKAGEAATMQAASGEANLADVVTAVTQAEVTLQTVMSIRDTLVDSYKRIIQMPI